MIEIKQNNKSNQINVSTSNVDNKLITTTNNLAKYYSDLAEKSKISAETSKQLAQESAQKAIESARLNQTDWLESDDTLKSFIKNKPNTVYTAGDGINIENNVITNTKISAVWGNLQGNLSQQTDLQNILDSKVNLSNISDISADKDLSNITQNALNIITQNVQPSFDDIQQELDSKINIEQASNASMPSNRYVDLTLGASGAKYTAPANGWFYCRIGTSGKGYLEILNTTTGLDCISQAPAADGVACYMPVKKNDICDIGYSSLSQVFKFRFVYAEGV